MVDWHRHRVNRHRMHRYYNRSVRLENRYNPTPTACDVDVDIVVARYGADPTRTVTAGAAVPLVKINDDRRWLSRGILCNRLVTANQKAGYEGQQDSKDADDKRLHRILSGS
jgi:hypothetical protein